MSMSGSLNLEVFQARWGKGQGLGWRCEQRISRAGNGTHRPPGASEKVSEEPGSDWGSGGVLAVGKGTAEE